MKEMHNEENEKIIRLLTEINEGYLKDIYNILVELNFNNRMANSTEDSLSVKTDSGKNARDIYKEYLETQERSFELSRLSQERRKLELEASILDLKEENLRKMSNLKKISKLS